jgi:hypothetical protein
VVTAGDAVRLLDLLAARGTIAWLVECDDRDGARLVVEVSGIDSALTSLVSRGFALVDDALPERLTVAHERHGRIHLLPVAFTASGDAAWHRTDSTAVTLPAAAFEPASSVPRRVRASALCGS